MIKKDVTLYGLSYVYVKGKHYACKSDHQILIAGGLPAKRYGVHLDLHAEHTSAPLLSDTLDYLKSQGLGFCHFFGALDPELLNS